MQNSSAAFHVQVVLCLGLEYLSPPILVPCYSSFSRTRYTIGTWLVVSETPPTNLQCSELAYPCEAFLDSWICFIERSWVYNGFYLVSIACIYLRWILLKVTLNSGRLAAANVQTQMHTGVRKHTWMNADKRKANCIQCAGGRNLKTRSDIKHLFKASAMLF